jgi:hypothetical protein
MGVNLEGSDRCHKLTYVNYYFGIFLEKLRNTRCPAEIRTEHFRIQIRNVTVSFNLPSRPVELAVQLIVKLCNKSRTYVIILK